MKKNLIAQLALLSVLIIISFQLVSCNYSYSNENNDVVTQVREVENFDELIKRVRSMVFA